MAMASLFVDAKHFVQKIGNSIIKAKAILVGFCDDVKALDAKLIVYITFYIKNSTKEFLSFVIGLQPKEILETFLFHKNALMISIAIEVKGGSWVG